MTELIHRDHLGEERRLGLIPPDANALAKRKACASFSGFLASKGLGVIPESEWKDKHYEHFDDPKWNLNQGRFSSCVGASSASAVMKLRYSLGKEFERLSGPYVYAHINGGRDAGAMITDAMRTIEKDGICLESEMNYPNIFANQISQKAKESGAKRQGIKAFVIASRDEFYSAIQRGFFPVFGVNVDSRFEVFDGNGVSGAGGGRENHAVHAAGMKKIRGRWCAYMPNTWDPKWGPFGNGACYIDPTGINLNDAYVVVDVEM